MTDQGIPTPESIAREAIVKHLPKSDVSGLKPTIVRGEIFSASGVRVTTAGQLARGDRRYTFGAVSSAPRLRVRTGADFLASDSQPGRS
jgi:hypothetical protein